MKKLLSFATLAIMFVACGSDTPDVVVKKCYNAFFEGDAKQFAKCFYFQSEDERREYTKRLTEDLSYIKTKIVEKGGIKSIETNILDISESKAKVSSVITHNNGRTENHKMNLTKINNTWYMDEKF
ncbi:DUF4878 domain-containing lipoprotein [Campylobacter sp. RM5004]|uniref:DUF4878 domain-containing protein n=1 Tax=Campylobacter sp. RM5004 TaxID=1660078 RepID=UPI001EFB4177|nr:DUF4878 domain-containing protein [Campylobacter sp. RM5004]ULO00987.1 DUF4878 domain-containing lipoprotein [Campylobacter sp. RM5004]